MIAAALLTLVALVPLVRAPAYAADEQDGQDADIATLDPASTRRVTALLVERCAGCHVPDAEDRKAVKRWDGALDLARTAANPDVLVPGDPDDSPLYYEIEDGEMPPEDSGVPGYSEEELAELRAWIAAGAPAPEPVTDGVALESAGDPPSAAPITPHLGPASYTQLFARAHVALVHFPIALLVVALLAELLGLRQAARFCLWLGALAATVASLAGWIHAEGGAGSSGDLDAHRWTGVATTVVAWATVLSCELRARDRKNLLVRFHLLFVLAGAVLVGLAGHWGGQIVWGTEYLSLP